MPEFEVLKVSPNGPIEKVPMSGNDAFDADTIRETIGGWLQPLDLRHPASGGVMTMWMDEEGKYKHNAEPNTLANVLARFASAGLTPDDVIVGTVVLTGLKQSENPEQGMVIAPLPEAWSLTLETLGDTITGFGG